MLGLWSSTEEAKLALGAVVAPCGIGCRLSRVGIGHERAACLSGDGGIGVVRCDDSALSFFDVVGGGASRGRGGVRSFES